jgi:transcriptional regulator with XRE-family HTH domain
MDDPRSDRELADWLRGLKDASGASYADIGRAIGEEERTVKRWMPKTGHPTVPSGDALLKLLDYFGVTLTPPAPRAVALSLMGELRELREAIVRLEGDEDSEELSLRRVGRDLREMSDLVTEALELLRASRPVNRQQAASAARGSRRSGKP